MSSSCTMCGLLRRSRLQRCNIDDGRVRAVVGNRGTRLDQHRLGRLHATSVSSLIERIQIPVNSSARCRRALLVTLAFLLGAVGDAYAVSKTCGANAVQNTQDVFCGPPTACTATSVRMTEPIEVTSGGCEFDLGGRTLSIEKNFQMTGQGFIRVI